MARSKEEEKKVNPAKDTKWRMTCMTIGKGERELDASENKFDTRDHKLLKEQGFKEDKEGNMYITMSDNKIESEIVNGKRVVKKRIAKDGKVLSGDVVVEMTR